ncbi:MAG TPA: AMP-binding protein, partial [Clostridia bacterium]|nr:AMP-binding protein [Clostridia bacterium]
MGEIKTPWLKYYGEVPAHLDYPGYTMEEAVEETAKKYPKYIAYDFMGKKTTYEKAVRDIHLCARALRAIGIKENDRVTICMPNAPQTIMMFYALNVIGAISNMVHPLSSENEIAFYLNDSRSVAAITLDQFYGKFAAIRDKTGLQKLIITSVADGLAPLMALGYRLTEGRKIAPIPKGADVVMWKDFLAAGARYKGEYIHRQQATDGAVILYSGGTTGVTKGILLSNLNF